MSMWDDSKYDYLWEREPWEDSDELCYEAFGRRFTEAAEQGLWLDRNGKLYEMAELADHHIMSILRTADKFPEYYTPLVHNVRREKERRDSLRKNKFFSESLI